MATGRQAPFRLCNRICYAAWTAVPESCTPTVSRLLRCALHRNSDLDGDICSRHATMSPSRGRWRRGKRASVRGTGVRLRSRHTVDRFTVMDRLYRKAYVVSNKAVGSTVCEWLVHKCHQWVKTCIIGAISRTARATTLLGAGAGVHAADLGFTSTGGISGYKKGIQRYSVP